MFTYKPGTPEARLADLFALAEQCGKAQSFVAGTADLDGAFEEARKALAAQIRAVSAELGTTQPPAEPSVLADPVTLRIGDEVWIRATVIGKDLTDKTRSIEVKTQNADSSAIYRHWPVTDSVYQKSA